MYRRSYGLKLALLAALLLVAGSLQNFAQADEVNVYSARKEALILPLLKRFEAETGIGFNLITAKADELLKRLEAEGRSTPADVFITTDAGRLQRAKEAGVLRAVDSPVLNARIPQNLRDRENHWFGLSQRARVIFYAKDRVEPGELSTYEALADTHWQQRVCIRSSGNIYNQSLVASMIEADGVEKAEAWARGLVANFARKPAGGDTDQLRAAAAGQCDVAVANTYYYGRLVNSDKEADREVASALGVFWPNQADRGAHVNVSGAGITLHAKHPEAALRLLEFLVSAESQTWYAEVNNEYPVVADAQTSELLKSFGQFKSDSLNLSRLGENNRAAVQLMDRAGWR
jgi:iron(III) transport system substrate-binding protein